MRRRTKFNRKTMMQCFEQDDVLPETRELAKAVAAYYKALCKMKAPWAKPFSDNVPIEHQTIFNHFLKTAEVIEEIQNSSGQTVSPREFVAAQFEGLSWANKVPYIGQLHTPAATLRYVNYLEKRRTREERTVREDDAQTETFAAEERKVERLAERPGVSTRRALRLMPCEFTEGFLRYRGVWDEVSSQLRD